MTVYVVRSISMSPVCFGVEAVGAMAVMRSPVTMMVWAAVLAGFDVEEVAGADESAGGGLRRDGEDCNL